MNFCMIYILIWILDVIVCEYYIYIVVLQFCKCADNTWT